MARSMRPTRRREGRGIGDRMSEVAVFILIGVGLVAAVRWYFFVYLSSPQNALSTFIGGIKAGKAQTQYDLLTRDEQVRWKSADAYDDKCPLGHGLAARIEGFNITMKNEGADKAEADVVLSVRNTGEKIYQAGSTSFNDHYVLVKEPAGWRVALSQSKVDSARVASSER